MLSRFLSEKSLELPCDISVKCTIFYPTHAIYQIYFCFHLKKLWKIIVQKYFEKGVPFSFFRDQNMFSFLHLWSPLLCIFPPRIMGWKRKKNTSWKIDLIPKGQNHGEELEFLYFIQETCTHGFFFIKSLGKKRFNNIGFIPIFRKLGSSICCNLSVQIIVTTNYRYIFILWTLLVGVGTKKN